MSNQCYIYQESFRLTFPGRIDQLPESMLFRTEWDKNIRRSRRDRDCLG